jgi:hypothetical protein
MPLLELLAWLMIAGGLLVLAGCIGLAFSIANEVETDPVLLPEVLTSWRSQESPTSSEPISKTKKSDQHESAGPVPINQP